MCATTRIKEEKDILDLIDKLNSLTRKVSDRLPWLVPKSRGGIHHTIFAMLLMMFALWLRLKIAPVEAGLQYLTFFPAVALAAIAGGFLSGLIATSIGLVLATFIFTPPYFTFSVAAIQTSMWSNIVFLMDGLIVSFSIETMHRFRQKYIEDTQQIKFANDLLTASNAEAKALLKRNQIMLQNSMEGIHIMNVDGNVIEANDAFCNMLGYTRDEALRLNVADWDVHWTREELRERFKSLIGGNELFETEQRRKDGVLIQVEISCCGIEFDGAGYLYAASRDISARKQNEIASLRHKLEIETAMDGYWLTDLQGNIQEVNQAYADMSGYSVAELTGMHISQLDAQERPEDVAARIQRLTTNGYDRFETRHRHKDGHVIDIEVSATLLEEMQQIFVFCRDISQRKQAQLALLRSEANLAAILDNAPFLAWLKDRDNRYIKVNKIFADFLHLDDAQQAIGKTDFDLQPADMAEKYRADDCLVMESRQKKRVEEPAFDGKNIHWVETYKTPIIDGEGHVLGTVGFASDITERKQAEEALRVAAVTFETHDAILITDANAIILRVNRAFTDITGYAPEEVLGKNPRILSSGKQDKAFYTEMWQQLLNTGSWSGEMQDRRKNGHIYPKWLTISAVKNERQETTHYVAIFSDISARKQAEEEIRNLAFYDALTKLPNRRLFMDRFRSALSFSARHHDYGAVFFIDLDRFKTLNDTLGHDYGDLLLIEVSSRIKSCVRDMDTVARLGGDEFVVLLEDISTDQEEASRKAGMVAEKIRETLAQPYRLNSHLHHCSPSIGISLYHGHRLSVDELLQQADMAMYQAKADGRNAVRYFDPVMQRNVATRTALKVELQHAISQGHMQLHYQLQIDNEQHPIGAEALLRWFHPKHGLLLPDLFIPIAEESTLILDIGHWVLEQACQRLKHWEQMPEMRALTVAVNISAKQFSQPNFVDLIADILSKHRVQPSKLKLELTESLVHDDVKSMIVTMHALRKLGIKLSMDDFGTGSSSLSVFKQLPLDQIKIDKEFIQGIPENAHDGLLVQSIIDMAQNFHVDVIAEGVETQAQLDFLKHHGCLSYQGYWFSKPLPIDAFEALIRRQ